MPMVTPSVTSSWMRLASGTAVLPGRFGGTGGRTVSGFGPVACHEPKYFSMTSFAASGVMSPTTTITARSGRKAR